jgi:hypothetical protein
VNFQAGMLGRVSGSKGSVNEGVIGGKPCSHEAGEVISSGGSGRTSLKPGEGQSSGQTRTGQEVGRPGRPGLQGTEESSVPAGRAPGAHLASGHGA